MLQLKKNLWTAKVILHIDSRYSLSITSPYLWFVIIHNLFSVSVLDYDKLFMRTSITMHTFPGSCLFFAIQSPTTINVANDFSAYTKCQIVWKKLFVIYFSLYKDEWSRIILNWYVIWQSGYCQFEVEVFRIILWEKLAFCWDCSYFRNSTLLTSAGTSR